MLLIRRLICLVKGHEDFEALSDGSKVWCGYCGKLVKS